MPTNETIPFSQLLAENTYELRALMTWQNYGMNDVTIPVVDLLKDHALMVLSLSYGKFQVEQSILDEVKADVFIYFPILMQQLAISRLMDAFGVVPEDSTTDTLTRTEVLSSEVEQSSELALGTTITATDTLNTQQKTTGTVNVENDVTNSQTGSRSIENSSEVESTGGKNVNLNHSMPEQAISGGGAFPTDAQGTPILSTSYVQGATESFNTSNPIDATETSEETNTSSATMENDTLTTNDVTVADTGTNTRATVNTGADTSESITETSSTNTITETRTAVSTNKQYAYEIKAFLESTDTLIAFSRWEDKFSWVVGII